MNRPSAKLPYWQLFLIAAAGLGGFALLMAFFPAYSRVAAISAAGLATVGTICLFIGSGNNNWWAQLGFLNAWLLLLVGISVRAFSVIVPWGATAGILVIVAYALAWSWPIIASRTSPDVPPKPRLGGGCTSWAIALGPSVIGVAAAFGVYGSRIGLVEATMLATGALGSAASIGIAQAMANRLWPSRPWFQRGPSPASTEPRGDG